MSIKDQLNDLNNRDDDRSEPTVSNSSDYDLEASADRELPSVNARKQSNKAIGAVVMVVAALFAGFQVYHMLTSKDKKLAAQEKKEAEVAKQNGVSGSLPPITVPDRPTPPSPQPVKPAQPGSPSDLSSDSSVDSSGPEKPVPPAQKVSADGKQVKSPEELRRERRMKGELALAYDSVNTGAPAPGARAQPAGYGDDGEGSASAGAGAGAGAGGSQGRIGAGASGNVNGSDLDKSLQPIETKGTIAHKLFDRNYLIAKGTFVDCALETRIDSTVSGMTSCIVTKNIYSDNGKLILVDRGSKVTGQYQGGIRMGQKRIFILWNRVETPQGVVVNLDSPGTDSLGASGVDGHIDTHFWERFGGAIMLSLIQDGFEYAANRESNGSTNQQNNFNFGNTRDASQNMATEALKSTINIPPTLVKNQGDHINIFVARDMDFRSVYDFRVAE